MDEMTRYPSDTMTQENARNTKACLDRNLPGQEYPRHTGRTGEAFIMFEAPC
jgi:hypothetical protein